MPMEHYKYPVILLYMHFLPISWPI